MYMYLYPQLLPCVHMCNRVKSYHMYVQYIYYVCDTMEKSFDL